MRLRRICGQKLQLRLGIAPPSYTTAHRPGIASVVGDRFVLDGTDLEEVEAHHAKTLKLVVERANQLTREAEERIRKEEHQRQAEAQAHAEDVETVAKGLSLTSKGQRISIL